MSLKDKIKPYMKFVKIISGIGSSGLFVYYQVWQTIKAVDGIVNTAVLDRERYTPEYIYIDDPMYELNMKNEADSAKRRTLVGGWWKDLTDSVVWRIFWLCRHGNARQRDMAIQRLVSMKSLKEWDYHKLAQVMDASTAVLLARTRCADTRLLLAPRRVLGGDLAPRLRAMLREMQGQDEHSCIQQFLIDNVDMSEEAAEPCLELHASRPEVLSDRQISLRCLHAMLHHVRHFPGDEEWLRMGPRERGDDASTSQGFSFFQKEAKERPKREYATAVEYLASKECLRVLAELLFRHGKEREFRLAVARLLCHFCVHLELRNEMFQLGLIRHMADWLRTEDLQLCSAAAVCLANLDPAHRAALGVYPPGVFLLHPFFRTWAPIETDVVFVHGLLGGAFVTWRQRDRVTQPVGLFGKAPPPPAPPAADAISQVDDMAPHPRYSRTALDPSEPEWSGGLRSPTSPDEESAAEDRQLASGQFEFVMHDLPVAALREDGAGEYTCNGRSHLLRDMRRDALEYTSCWPRDWLPRDCAHIRVLAVNYETALSQWARSCGLAAATARRGARAAALGRALRSAGLGRRSTVWLAHSMGGLLVTTVLVDACESVDPRWQELSRATRALVFYSTPHRGSPVASIKPAAAAILCPSEEVRELREDSPELTSLNAAFGRCAARHAWRVLSLAESVPTLVAGWELTLVPVHSADPGLGEMFLLPLDHLRICKPATRHSFLYLKVVSVLQEVSGTRCNTCLQRDRASQASAWKRWLGELRLSVNAFTDPLVTDTEPSSEKAKSIQNQTMFSFDEAEDPLADPFAGVSDDPFKDVTQPADGDSSDEDAPLAIPAHPATDSSSKINLKVYKIPVVEKISIVREKAGGRNGYVIKSGKTARNGVKKQEKVAIKKEDKILVKKLVKLVTKKNGIKKQENVDIKRDGVTKMVEEDGAEKAVEETVKKTDHKLKTNGINGQHWERVCVELDPAAFFPDEPVTWPKCRSNYKSTKTFRCQYCGKGYNMLRALSIHSESRHGTMAAPRAHPCEVCPAVLCTPRLLDAHRAAHVHHGRLPCLLCMPPLAQPGDTWCGIDESPDREPEPVRVRFPYRKHPTWWYYSVKGLTRHRAAEHPEAGTLGVDWHGQWGDR